MKSFVLCSLVSLSALCLASNLPQKSGQATYEKHCVNCHGKDGAGKTAAAERMAIPDLRSSSVVSMSDKQLADSVGRGVQHKNYPHSFLLNKEISNDELQVLIGYVRSLQKK